MDSSKNFSKHWNTIIIGAGPAGLFAAIHSKCQDVLLLEKNDKPGKKLLISGTGRCNITHECRLSEFFNHYGDNSRFLKTALHAYTNEQLIQFFNSNGLPTVIDKNDKVFPKTQKAEDVLQVLLACCRKMNVTINYNQSVVLVERTSFGFRVQTSRDIFTCNKLILTTGGMSYPATGSNGDGYSLAKQLGHSIIPPKPSLSPVFVSNYLFVEVAGVSLSDVLINIYREDKKIRSHQGDIGFTHKGLSGPGILDASRYIQSGDILKLNFAHLTPDEFRNAVLQSGEKEGKVAIQTWAKKLELPRSLLLTLLQIATIEPDCKMGQITKIQRNALVSVFCECSFEVSRVGGFNMAMATSGGVNLNEINPKTMESKLVNNLYFAGEVIDIDGDTGGYNLQAAFSTGYLAAIQVK